MGSLALGTGAPPRVGASLNNDLMPGVLIVARLRELTDSELVLRTRKGDEDAFGVLVERYMRASYAVAFSVTGRHEDAQDAAQESLLVALERLDECRSPEKFGGWLMTIVRNRARNLVRREVLRDTDQVPETASSRSPTPDRDLETAELRASLGDALSSLPEIQRQIVLLHDLEGWKHREIAERLDLPSGTVRSHLHFARKALRSALEALRPHDGDEAVG